MKTDGVNLGGVRASNLTAVIPDSRKKKLLIDADIKGPGKAVGPYFDDTAERFSGCDPAEPSSTAM